MSSYGSYVAVVVVVSACSNSDSFRLALLLFTPHYCFSEFWIYLLHKYWGGFNYHLEGKLTNVKYSFVSGASQHDRVAHYVG